MVVGRGSSPAPFRLQRSSGTCQRHAELSVRSQCEIDRNASVRIDVDAAPSEPGDGEGRWDSVLARDSPERVGEHAGVVDLVRLIEPVSSLWVRTGLPPVALSLFMPRGRRFLQSGPSAFVSQPSVLELGA